MPTNFENATSGTLDQTADFGLNQSTALDTQSSSHENVVVVGLYGVPGSGKTFLLNQLKQEFEQEHFTFYEGSKMIGNIVPGGLSAFQKLEQQEQVRWREQAIETIRKECVDGGKVAVVAGHFMFWPEDEEDGQPVYTQNDLDTFTHILYLDVPAEMVMQRRLNDMERNRPSTSITHLRKWQEAEKTRLRHLCRHHNILFSLVTPHPTLLNKVSTLLRDFCHHTEKHNLSYAEKRLDEALAANRGQLETVLVMDADRTLSAEDSGALFWEFLTNSRLSKDEEWPLKRLFGSPLGFSYTAFRQAALLYEEMADDQEFDTLCRRVASAIAMYPEIVSLLELVGRQDHVGVVIVSCGLSRVWEMVLERGGLSNTVKVIGGGRISDGFVITPTVKASLVVRLQEIHQVHVLAFGDSPLDLEMLCKADEAIVVVGEENKRSKSMETALGGLIEKDQLSARQLLLPKNVSPRLDTTKLPVIQLTGMEFACSVLKRRDISSRLRVIQAGRERAELLATPMRDAAISGHLLREHHRRAGWYLAVEFLTGMIGTEKCQISHVLGHETSGCRLRHERQTTIMALMRGGEPMAFGVSDAFPLAMFVHAQCPRSINHENVIGQDTLLLVDSVVNSGKTVLEFVQAIHNIHPTIRIVVVAGVVQEQCVSQNSLIQQAFACHGNLSLVTLRLSGTKFTGSGNTDTGNRLFNTTHLS